MASGSRPGQVRSDEERTSIWRRRSPVRSSNEPVGDGGRVAAVDEAGPRVDPAVTPRAAVPVDDRSGRKGSGRLTAGLVLLGLATALTGAWGGIVAYVGPTFGYSANATGSWAWTWQHSLLYLIPGAVAVAAGLWLWAMAARSRAGSGRLGTGAAGVIVVACGAWFVLGPLVWAMFYTTAVFGPASATDNFVNQLGYNLGPGVVLAALGGAALAAGSARRRAGIKQLNP